MRWEFEYRKAILSVPSFTDLARVGTILNASGVSPPPLGRFGFASLFGADTVSKAGVEVRMRINGWQRLWLLASILWAVVILVLAGILRSDGDQTVLSANVVLLVVRLWMVPVSAVYGFGIGLAWVRRGFQLESK